MLSLIKLFRFLNKYKGSLIFSICLLFVSTLLTLVQPRMVQIVVDEGIKQKEMATILLWGGGIVLAAIFSSLINFGSGYLLIKSSHGMAYDLRGTLFKKVFSFSFQNLDKFRTGELMVRINSDVNTIMMFVRMGFFMIIQSLVMIIGSLLLMYSSDPGLASIMAVIMPSVLVVFLVIATLVRPVFLKMRKKLDELNNVLQENLAGASLVKAFVQKKQEIKKFNVKNKGFYEISLKIGTLMSLLFPLLFLIGQVTMALVVMIGGQRAINALLVPGVPGITVGQLLEFNNYAMMAMFPILMLGMVLNFVSMAAASAERIFELLNEQPAITEKAGAVRKEKLNGDIAFVNASFRYGHGEMAVSDFSMEIKSGEKIGIIGPTGAGKSSLAYLIPRFYDVNYGSVLIDGENVRDYSLSSLRRSIAYVLQESTLFAGTIKENLLFVNPDASDNELWEALNLAQAADFVKEKENQLEEVIGEKGVGLSGGQRQRLAIARAILSNPDILILDDVTSSLDLETESKVIDGIYEKLPDCTIIIISQKINAVRSADRIIVMKDGKCQEKGTHQELLKIKGIYKEIFNTQVAQDQGVA
ncbi:MAG: ABC transporter ATP-binding protein [Spirochaetales bacterium]|nr:ABC transporter ATP-binding protein [Spirochaetales bacterium]